MELITPGLGLVFWTFLVFIAVFLFLRAKAWPTILSALKEREDSIQSALDEAEKARGEMAKLKSDNENLLQEARQERDQMLKEARDAANKVVEEAQAKATAEYNKIIEDARSEIQREKSQAMAEVKTQIADFSITIAEKLVRKQLNDQGSQKQLAEEYVKDLNLN